MSDSIFPPEERRPEPPLLLDVFDRPVTPVPGRQIPRRRPRLARRIVLCTLIVFLAVLAVTVWLNWPLIDLVLHPEKITLASWPDARASLELLARRGEIRDLEIHDDEDAAHFSFRTAEGSISVSADYQQDTLRGAVGHIVVEKVSVRTIAEGQALAQVLLSPFLSPLETRAMLVRRLPDIVVGAGNDNLDMDMEVIPGLRLVIRGSPYDVVEFTLALT